MTDVIVIGAGLAGLTVGHRMHAAGVDVHVIDRAPVAGGHMRTQQRKGWRHELGPNSFLGSATALMSLAEELGLKIVQARDVSKKRYLFLDGRLQALPTHPLHAITTGLLPFSAKLRALWEPFTSARMNEETTIREFFEAHFGREVADRFVDAFVSGVYAGDIDAMSMAAAFPRIYEQAQKHGSLIKAIPSMARSGKSPGARRGTFSLEGGLGALPAAIAAKLGDRLHLGQEVSLEREGSGWRVGDLTARNVVLATPTFASAALLKDRAPALAQELASIAYNPIAGVHLLYRKSAVANPLDGFGFLIPRREKIRLLGCIWSSSLFDVCDAEHVSLTCFIGGARDPEVVALPPEQIIAAVRRDLERTLGITDAPEDASVVQIPRAIPVYGRKHVALRGRINALTAEQSGLFLAGNYLEGVAMTDTIALSEKVARLVQGKPVEEKRAA